MFMYWLLWYNNTNNTRSQNCHKRSQQDHTNVLRFSFQRKNFIYNKHFDFIEILWKIYSNNCFHWHSHARRLLSHSRNCEASIKIKIIFRNSLNIEDFVSLWQAFVHIETAFVDKNESIPLISDGIISIFVSLFSPREIMTTNIIFSCNKWKLYNPMRNKH